MTAVANPSKDTEIEHWKNDNISITVEQNPGYWSSIKLIARVPLPPEELFNLLTDENNATVFRSIKKKIVRKVLKDDGHGNIEVDTEQIGRWSWGPFKGSFGIRLIVNQYRDKKQIDFRLATNTKRSPFMKDFTGSWIIQPFDQDSIDELVRYPNKKWNPFLHNAAKAIHRLESRLTGHHVESSLVQLRQSVAPRVIPPGPLDGVFRKIAITQVRTVMEDLMKEAERRNEARNRKEQQLLPRDSGENGGRSDNSDHSGIKKASLLAHVRKLER